MSPHRGIRIAGLAAATAVPLALAYRFALIYRVRAGFPRQHPPIHTPGALGLPWEDVTVPRLDGGPGLPAWFIPAGVGDAPAPGVVLVHGWESARDRLLPHAQFLHAAGFHVLVFDVRGCGANPPEALPVSVGEFALDTRAAVAWLAARPEVSKVGVVGHSMGAAGALVAAAGEPLVAAVVGLSTPSGPERLTRQTFRLANLPFPSAIAWPLAWLTTRVYLRPRGHAVAAVSASHAIRRIAAPVLLVHGTDDPIVPISDLGRLAGLRRRALPDAVTQTLAIREGRHSWLYEFGAVRAGVAGFLATCLGGPRSPADAAEAARECRAERLPEPERLSAVDEEPGGLRSLLTLLEPGTTRLPSP